MNHLDSSFSLLSSFLHFLFHYTGKLTLVTVDRDSSFPSTHPLSFSGFLAVPLSDTLHILHLAMPRGVHLQCL